MTGSLAGVGATALLTAYARAQERRRDDRLFDDPWAGPFVLAATGAEGDDLPRLGMARPAGACELWETFREYFVARTPFYDERILGALREGARQVVVPAAGMDSRAFRLRLPVGTTLYEVDAAPVLDFKNAVLAERGAEPGCRRVCVPADLREPWVESLVEAGLSTDEPIVWVVEGLLMYLTAEQSDQLLATITKHSVTGSRLLTEYPARRIDEQTLIPRTIDEIDGAAAQQMVALVRSGPTVEPDRWLRTSGWDPEVTDIATRIAAFGRPVPELLGSGEDCIPVWLLAGTLA